MTKIHQKDFVEIKFTGYVNNEPFDSNISDDLKKINPEIEAKKTLVCVGERMLVKGFDNALIDKETGKDYEVNVSPSDGFGERKTNLIKTIPLKFFTQQKINPFPGLSLNIDNMIVKVIAVSGARVIADFNHPLAGKELHYKFNIVRKIEDEKEKAEALFEFFFRSVPEFEISDKIKIKGPKYLGAFVNVFKERFKELLEKELIFEEIPVESNKEPQKTQQ